MMTMDQFELNSVLLNKSFHLICQNYIEKHYIEL